MVRAYQVAWWTAMACGLVSTGLDRDTAHQFESAPHCAPLPAAALLPSLNNAMLIRYVHNKATLLRLTARTHRTAHARESEDINTRVKGQGQRTRGKQTGMGGTLRGVVRAFWIFHFYLFFSSASLMHLLRNSRSRPAGAGQITDKWCMKCQKANNMILKKK